MNNNKIYYFQILRAIAIIAVILIHSDNPKLNDVLNIHLQIVFRQFINYPVALFFFISGYFIKVEDGKFEFSHRIKKILIPYSLWTLIGIILFQHFSGRRIVFDILTGQAMPQLYYIVVLVQLMILTPFLIRTLNNKKIMILVLLSTPLLFVCFDIYYYVSRNLIDFPFNAITFVSWITYYYFGILFKNIESIENMILSHKKIIYIGYLIGIMFAVSIGLAIYNINPDFLTLSLTQIKITSFLVSIFLICSLMTLKERIKPNKFLIYIGDQSFGLFFVHIIIMRIVLKTDILNRITNQIFYQISNTIITLLISLIVIYLVKKVFGEKIPKKYLGF